MMKFDSRTLDNLQCNVREAIRSNSRVKLEAALEGCKRSGAILGPLRKQERELVQSWASLIAEHLEAKTSQPQHSTLAPFGFRRSEDQLAKQYVFASRREWRALKLKIDSAEAADFPIYEEFLTKLINAGTHFENPIYRDELQRLTTIVANKIIVAFGRIPEGTIKPFERNGSDAQTSRTRHVRQKE